MAHGKRDLFATGGRIDGDGNPVPADQQIPLSVQVQSALSKGPIVGVIHRIYYSNSSLNTSNSEINVTSPNTPEHEIDGGGYLTRSEFTTLTSGSLLQADVKIVKGFSGPVDSSQIISNVPICIGFGGINNYGFVVPTATSNTSGKNYTGKENGDYCLVQFIGGNWEGRVITQIWPNPLNVLDPPTAQEGVISYQRVNGTSVTVNSDGDFILDARNAGQIVSTDPNTGAVTKKDAKGGEGSLSVVSRSDIVISAGMSRTNEEETDLPLGNAALKASRLLTLRSTLDEIELNTEGNDASNLAMQVKIQGERGSLRPAARKNDKVKITSGDAGDLFYYIDTLHNLLEVVGKALASSLIEPGAKAAGELINAFIGCHPKPSYQEGEIIEGSIYCQIAGKGTAADIGGDESGILDCDGNPISSTDLMAKTVSAYTEAAASGVVSQLNPNPINIAKGMAPTALNQLGMTLQKIPFTKAAGDAIVKASPQITLALEMISTGELPENTSTPASAQDKGYTNITEITGKRDEDGNVTTPGLLQESELITNRYNWMEDREKKAYENDANLKAKYGSDTSWWPINTNTGVYFSYAEANPASAEYSAASLSIKAEYKKNSSLLQEVLSGFDASWLPLPAAQKLYAAAVVGGGEVAVNLGALGADPSIAEVKAAIAPLTEVLGPGGSIEADADSIIDNELACD